MLSQSGIEKKTYVAPKQILFATEPAVAVSVRLETDEDKLVKAGTPISGQLHDRKSTPFRVVTNFETETPTGVVLHDVMCKAGQEMNSECLIFGFVDLDKLDDDVKGLCMKAAMPLFARVTFISGNK